MTAAINIASVLHPQLNDLYSNKDDVFAEHILTMFLSIESVFSMFSVLVLVQNILLHFTVPDTNIPLRPAAGFRSPDQSSSFLKEHFLTIDLG
jgi:hypothetical protein